MKNNLESQNWLEISLPCGRKSLISKEHEHILNIFPMRRFSGGYMKICRYLKTEFGTVKEEYYFHRLIMNFPKAFEIDHVNRNKLDNRIENLRLATRGENQVNKNKAKNCTSKYRGVSYNNRQKKWVAYINHDGKRKHIGYFENEDEAAIAYNICSKEKYGQFAFINNIGDTNV